MAECHVLLYENGYYNVNGPRDQYPQLTGIRGGSSLSIWISLAASFRVPYDFVACSVSLSQSYKTRLLSLISVLTMLFLTDIIGRRDQYPSLVQP
jgi:hypothetical protein